MPAATYVLTDFDRLGPWELELATHLFLALKADGIPVLNNPGAFRPRHAMLEHFRAENLNSFRSWCPAYGQMPNRFPVFLRSQAAHRGPITDLIHDPGQARAALEEALMSGHPLGDLQFIEYAAEALGEGFFQKHAAFRIGDTIVPALSVFSSGWAGKMNEDGRVPNHLYRRELNHIEDYPHRDSLMRVFRSANIDYGRIDFGIVDGRIETYEINTNPWLGYIAPDPKGERPAVKAAVQAGYVKALRHIDTTSGDKSVRLTMEPFTTQRRKDRRWLWTRRWTP
ncbi:MAG: hypothetical protein ACE363_01745 [Alphaproteobacteria bacterium]